MIFKLQRPLCTSESSWPCLVYNEDRSIEFMVPLLPELLELFGDEYKIYIDSNIKNPNSKTLPEALIVGTIVEEQDW